MSANPIIDAALRGTAAAKSFFGIEQSLAEIAATVRGLRDGIERLEARREFLLKSPLGLEDTAEIMAAAIDRTAEEWPQTLAFQQHYKRGDTVDSVGQYQRDVLFQGFNRAPGSQAHFLAIHGALCFAFGKEFKAAARKALERLDWSQAGPPNRLRDKELAEIEKDLARMRAEESEIVDRAVALGISL